MGSNPLSMMVGIMLRMNYMGIGEPYVGKVYVDYRIKRHTPLPVLYISPPPTLLNFYHYRDSSR